MAGGYINLIKGGFRMVLQIQTVLLPILYCTPPSLFLSLPLLDTSQCQTHLALIISDKLDKPRYKRALLSDVFSLIFMFTYGEGE